MNRTILMKHAKRLALGLAAIALAATPSFAQKTYNLCASDGTVTIAGEVIPIWGYVDLGDPAGPCTLGLATTLPGPDLSATAGETVTLNLFNALSEDVSIFIPGYRATVTGGVAGRFTGAAAPGGSVTYSFTARAGTFLYHSATDRIRTQVPMGLYGALVVDVAAGQAYPDVPYDQDQVLVYSAIDPRINADPGGFGGARVAGDRDLYGVPIGNWDPQYFLINGQAHPATVPVAFGTGDNVLLRFVNAGLESVMPTLEGGIYLDLIAEDGNRYPHPIQQYGLELQAGKTIDAMVSATDEGSYALYDRAGHLTNGAATGGGMLTYLEVSAGAGIFQLDSASYSVDENVGGGIVTITVNRVGGSAGAVSVDYATADGTATAGSDYTAIPTTTLDFADLQTSATFDVTILDDAATPLYEGDETFTVTLSNPVGASLGTPSSAEVTIVDNEEGPGALQLSAATYSAAENGGPLTVTVNRVGGSAGAVSVDYATADGSATDGSDYTGVTGTLDFAAGVTSQTFVVDILDDSTYEGPETFSVSLSNPVGTSLGTPSTAVVTITEDDPAPNQAPVANDDVATIQKGTTLQNFNVVANDVDPDGTINATSVVIITGANSQFGGTVVNNGNGTVTYTPPNPGWRGTDTFQYTVEDNDGEPSNPATVRVNVVR